MWKSIITTKSAVDLSGNMSVTFDVMWKTYLVYPNITINGTPDQIIDRIHQKMDDLITQVDTANNIKVQQVIRSDSTAKPSDEFLAALGGGN